MSKVVVVLSGGMDSATLLYKVLADGHEVDALSVNYSQRHSRELYCAEDLCKHLGIPWTCVDLTGLSTVLKGSSQSDPNVEVPEGHYEEPSMKKTVVPNRNMLLLATATAHCISIGYDAVAYGAHAGDHAIYPDCRKEFVLAMGEALQLCDYSKVKLIAPFLGMDKGDIAILGGALGVPYEKTWTCYNPQSEHAQFMPSLGRFSLEWLVGFLEGDGHFSHKAQHGKRYPRFWITQKDEALLLEIKQLLGFGSVSHLRDGVYAYEVAGGNNCRRLAHLFAGSLRTTHKQEQFRAWVDEFSLHDFRDALACGKCGACHERIEAFDKAFAADGKTTDPLVYQ